jgi:hypothetical protein
LKELKVREPLGPWLAICPVSIEVAITARCPGTRRGGQHDPGKPEIARQREHSTDHQPVALVEVRRTELALTVGIAEVERVVAELVSRSPSRIVAVS